MEECKKDYYDNGNVYMEFYYKDSKCHRDNLPAAIVYDPYGNIKSEYYSKDGYCHREDGLAMIYYHNDGKIESELYYLYDEFYGDKDITDNWKAFCKMQIFR